jgi:hypothetical protein
MRAEYVMNGARFARSRGGLGSMQWSLLMIIRHGKCFTQVSTFDDLFIESSLHFHLDHGESSEYGKFMLASQEVLAHLTKSIHEPISMLSL